MDLIYINPLNSPYENYNGATATTLPWNPHDWTNLFSLLVRCYMSWTYPGNSWIGGGSTEPQEFALNLPAFDRAFDEAGGVTLGVRKIGARKCTKTNKLHPEELFEMKCRHK